MSSKSRIPSPSRSQGSISTPRRRPRLSGSRSVGSPRRPLRLSTVVQRFKDDEISSPNVSNNGSVLSDNTDIMEPRRRSWWKSTNVMSILENDENQDVNNVLEKLEEEEEVISQGEKYDTLDLPESSDSESIVSIIIPEKRLLAKKNKVLKTFPRVSSSRILQKTLDNEKTIALKASPKKLFKKTQKRTRPQFPDALLNMTTIANRTSGDKTIEVKAPLRTLLNNRGTKRKNMFQNFIAAESDDDISEVQPKVFGFQKTGQPRNSNLKEPQSPSSSIASDLDGHWNLLPSSTMMEGCGFEHETPGKKAKMSKLSNIRDRTLKDRFDIGLINEDDIEVRIEKQAITENNIVNESLKKTSVSELNLSKQIAIDNNEINIAEQILNTEANYRSTRIEISESTLINNTVKEISIHNISRNKSTVKNRKLSSQSISQNSKVDFFKIKDELNVDMDMIADNDEVKVESIHARDTEAIEEANKVNYDRMEETEAKEVDQEKELDILEDKEKVVKNKVDSENHEESEKEDMEQDVINEDDDHITQQDLDDENMVQEDEIADENEEQDLENEKQEHTAMIDDNDEQIDKSSEIVHQSEHEEQEIDLTDENYEMEVSAEVDGEGENEALADNDVDQIDEIEENSKVSEDNNEMEESSEVVDQDEEVEECAEVVDQDEEVEECAELADDNNEMIVSTDVIEHDQDVEESAEIDDNDEAEACEDPSQEEEEEELEQNESWLHVEREESKAQYESEEIAEHEDSADEDQIENEVNEQEESNEIEANDISFDNRADVEYSTDANPSMNISEENTFVQNPLPPATKMSQQMFIKFLEEIKQKNFAKQEEIRERFRETLKSPLKSINNLQFHQRISKDKPQSIRVPPEFKPKRKTKTKYSAETLAALPKNFYNDLKYKPPKRYTPPNTSWATKRLYTFLENKLEPRYDYLARIRAEKFVMKLFEFSKQIKKLNAAPRESIHTLQRKMASLNIIETYSEFYEFFREYLPKEIRVKVIPDIINKLPLPPGGIHARIIQDKENEA